MDFRIKFSGKSHDYTQDEIDTVVQAMRTAEPYTQGVYQQTFERKFGDYIGAGQAFAVSNATAALEMAAQLCQFEPGDEVIIPSHTFTSSAYPFAKKGAKIIWADIDLRTRVVTADTLSQRISPNTKAIVVVHLYGYAADMPSIAKLAKDRGILLIEDVAQSMGTSINEQKSGTFGDIGIFSLHSHKNITTLGEGGIIVVKSPELAAIIPMIRHNGHCLFPYEREHYWIPAMGNVDFPELNGRILWPNNYCLGEVECALGAKLLDRIDRMNKEKRTRALNFIDTLKHYDTLEFHRVDSVRHNYHLLAARVTEGKRDELMKFMAYEKGIQCVVQYYPLNRYPLYRRLGFGEADCPNTDRFFDNMISFPFHHWMSDADFQYMLQSTREALERRS
ncbi:MAG: DegT/DnrJ/EryC1/StrS family aminotransferase [Syntrophorhabdaceae bacterium]